MGRNVKHTYSAGGVVVNSRGEVLVVNQRGNSWSLPKGHVEKGEDPAEAAKREIYEESGLKKVKLIRRFGNYRRYKIGKHGKGEDRSELKTIVVFLFKTNELKLKPLDPHNPEARWVKKEKVAGLLTHPRDKELTRRS